MGPAPRAPAEHQGVLALPDLGQAGQLLEFNQQLLAQAKVTILGRSLSDLRRKARQAACHSAHQYFLKLDEPIVSNPNPGPMLLAGHQPELFHPGVWVKNFALQGLARRWRGLPLNLIVDNDLAKTAAIRAPGKRKIETIPVDQWPGELPFEEWAVHDEDYFRDLPRRLAPLLETWPFQPILEPFWRNVIEARGLTPLVGERFAMARRAWERRWDCQNLEVPLSQISQGEAFAWFAMGLMAEAPRLFTVYNDCVRAYRHAQGIRSRSHPVPDLAADHDWLELPLWGWRAGERKRLRIFVKTQGDDWHVRAGAEPWIVLSGPMDQRLTSFQSLESLGCKIRPRALTTTWFARLFVADLFLHGLGGGLYDRLTDEIMSRWHGITPPRFMILSATLKLPFACDPRAAEHTRELAWLERDLQYNPQRHLASRASLPSPWRKLLQEKDQWMGWRGNTPGKRREQYKKIRALNESLRPLVEEQIDHTRGQRQDAQVRERQAEIQMRRDFAFCLFPSEMLQQFLRQFLHE